MGLGVKLHLENSHGSRHGMCSSDQIRSDIGLLRVDKRNSTIDSRNDTCNNGNK